jgi:DNA-binding NarL/FixJ family response regulator
MLQPWCVQLPIIVLMPGESGGPAQGPFGSKKDGTNLSLHLRVLIAEDEGLVALNIETALSEAGFDVLETVDTEADAVAAMERLRPDLIILDITLREGSGISAAKAIKRISAIPIIFVSGNSDPATLAAASDLKPAAFIRKPFITESFAALVADAVARTN